ncbi:hypothetical protein CH256_03570 [Rhodococcus sp. 05-2254-6]|nr:hypothetical protein CH256_03570 [Rhodococcus sp. 05-2254-6]
MTLPAMTLPVAPVNGDRSHAEGEEAGDCAGDRAGNDGGSHDIDDALVSVLNGRGPFAASARESVELVGDVVRSAVDAVHLGEGLRHFVGGKFLHVGPRGVRGVARSSQLFGGGAPRASETPQLLRITVGPHVALKPSRDQPPPIGASVSPP